jgi:hypothetical protein
VPTSVDFFSTFSQFVFGFQSDHLNTVVLSLWPITILLGFFALRKTKALGPETQYFMVTVLLSSVLAFFVSVIQPVFVSRYLIFTVPSLYLLLASLLDTYPPRAATIAKWAVVLLMLAALGLEMFSANPGKENYREAAVYLNSHVGPAGHRDTLGARLPSIPSSTTTAGRRPLPPFQTGTGMRLAPYPRFAADTLPQGSCRHHKGPPVRMAPLVV